MANNTGHQLYGIWKREYRKRHGQDYVGSKYRDAAMLKGVAEDIGVDTLKDLMLWYFENKAIHDFTYFIFNYDELMKERRLREQDAVYREKLRERTRKLMAERKQEGT